jgi:hypothetical protein
MTLYMGEVQEVTFGQSASGKESSKYKGTKVVLAPCERQNKLHKSLMIFI